MVSTVGVAMPASFAQQTPAGGLGLLEALRLTLTRDPNIAIQETRVTSSRGALEVASSAFDPVLSSSASRNGSDSPVSESASRQRTSILDSISYNVPFRSGLQIQPGVSLDRESLPGAPAASTGTVSFRIRQPLLQGRGRDVVAAGELSAQRELRASELDLRFATAQRMVAVASQYWQARAAQLNLEVLVSSEQSSREMLDTTRRLVEADETPAAELVQLEANLAAKESARIDGERALFAARQSLGREIGLDAREIAALPMPSDLFPALRPEELPPQGEADRLVALALRRRADLRAARERQVGLDILARAAENALKPQLDLVLTPSYTGFTEGGAVGNFFSPLFRNVPGLSTLLTLNFALPTRNLRAQGLLLEARASLRQSALVSDLVGKEIGADVPTALDAVRRNAEQLQKAAEAVRLFEKTVSNEEKKLRAGTSTLINLITQRDRLTSARQVRVSAQLSLALALLDLRFQTGTLLAEEREAVALQEDRLTRPPTQEEP
ncbi:MAG TPA: TolC family protein [Thermoanaerobaculia bacterium]